MKRFLPLLALVPFWNDPAYERDEPTDPPWWVRNNLLPSKLYLNGVYQSEETGTNDLQMEKVWQLSAHGIKVGVVDMTEHGDRVVDLVRQATHNGADIFRHELQRYYPEQVAAGFSNCVNQGARVIVFSGGVLPVGDFTGLSNSCRYAESSNVAIVCAVPNAEQDIDAVPDYPSSWPLSNVLPISGLDRNGRHWSPSASGTNVLAAPARNIVAYGTYSTGTSWAAPIAAGCLALLMDRYPGQTPKDYIVTLHETATADRGINPLAALQAPQVRYVYFDGRNVAWKTNQPVTVSWSTNLLDWQPLAGERTTNNNLVSVTWTNEYPEAYFRLDYD